MGVMGEGGDFERGMEMVISLFVEKSIKSISLWVDVVTVRSGRSVRGYACAFNWLVKCFGETTCGRSEACCVFANRDGEDGAARVGIIGVAGCKGKRRSPVDSGLV